MTKPSDCTAYVKGVCELRILLYVRLDCTHLGQGYFLCGHVQFAREVTMTDGARASAQTIGRNGNVTWGQAPEFEADDGADPDRPVPFWPSLYGRAQVEWQARRARRGPGDVA
jgi:hypothetical protein